MLWVEDDSTPPADAFLKLRRHADPEKFPVMHGVSFDRMAPYAPSIWRVRSDGSGMIEPIWDWQDDRLYECAHSGTCAVLFHTSVWERLKRPWFRMQSFEPGQQGMIPCISLSMRMHEAGIPIMAHTGCVAGHMTEAVEVDASMSRSAHAAGFKRDERADGEPAKASPPAGLMTRAYDSYDDYLAHQKEKTTAILEGRNNELGPFNERVAMFRRILGPIASRFDAGDKVLCLGARRGEELTVFENFGLYAWGLDLVTPDDGSQYMIQGDFHEATKIFDLDEFDLVFSNSVDHALDLDKFLWSAMNVLKPGGMLLLHLVLGAWSDEMSLKLDTADNLIVHLPEGMTVIESEEIPTYGGGCNWKVLAQKAK